VKTKVRGRWWGRGMGIGARKSFLRNLSSKEGEVQELRDKG